MEKVYIVPDGCWEWVAVKNQDGYGNFKFQGIMVKAHRISYQIFNGDIYNNLCVLHTCDNPGCVNPAHLYLGTQQDNADDRETKGRGHEKSGEANGRAKLTAEEVWQIREVFATQLYTQRELGHLYKIANTVVSKIVRFELWPNTPNPYGKK